MLDDQPRESLDDLGIIAACDRIGELIPQLHAQETSGEARPANIHALQDVFVAASYVAVEAVEHTGANLGNEREVVAIGLLLEAIASRVVEPEVNDVPASRLSGSLHG